MEESNELIIPVKSTITGFAGIIAITILERFGFYLLMSILFTYLQTVFMVNMTVASETYSTFYAFLYIFMVVGGLLCDFVGSRKTIATSLLLLVIGYMMAGSFVYTGNDTTSILTMVGLFLVVIGSAIFRPSSMLLIGNLFEYSKFKRFGVSAFVLLFFAINIGAILAPATVVFVRNKVIEAKGFKYDGNITDMSINFLNGESVDKEDFIEIVKQNSGHELDDLSEFCTNYLNGVNSGYSSAILVSAVAMLLAMILYFVFSKHYKEAGRTFFQQRKEGYVFTLTEGQKLYRALALPILIVLSIPFVTVFHQTGLTLTFFLRDYTDIIDSDKVMQINPLMIIILSPFAVIAFWLIKRKNLLTMIGVGMFIACVAFAFILFPSASLQGPVDAGYYSFEKVSYLWVVGAMIIASFAEVIISPVTSYFSFKMAPLRLKGLFIGLFMLATALGNKLMYLLYELWSQTSPFITFLVCTIVLLILGAVIFIVSRIRKPEIEDY